MRRGVFKDVLHSGLWLDGFETRKAFLATGLNGTAKGFTRIRSKR